MFIYIYIYIFIFVYVLMYFIFLVVYIFIPEEIGFEPTRIGNIRSVSNRSHLTNSCALPRGVEGIEPTTG